jgi:gamma-butyrobetaine dioxygenase
VDDLVTLLREMFESDGASAYLGEDVTQAVHMLQAGALALAAGAPDHLVVAAVLHDVGHFGAADPMGGHDNHHDDAGAELLARWFPPSVTEPVRLHVAAKRYLCAVDPAYAAVLSPASVHSLALQGGPMGDAERAAFEANPHHADAVAVRRWDDAAKDHDAPVPPFDAFAAAVVSVARAATVTP